MNWKNVSGVVLLVLVACILALGLNHSLFGSGLVTIVIQAVAVVLMIWARLTFGIRSFHGTANPTAGGLVTNGPYSYFRHPIYAAILYFLWAAIAAHSSPTNAALALLATAMLLAKEYPEYADYSLRTKRVIPFLLYAHQCAHGKPAAADPA
jgi:protein-S-isoprenylcysteine O-methyltransferase Ste14